MAKLTQEQQTSLEKFYQEYDTFITDYIKTALSSKTSGKQNGQRGFPKYCFMDVEDIRSDFYVHFFSSSGRIKQYYKNEAEEVKTGEKLCKNCKYFLSRKKYHYCNHESNIQLKLDPFKINKTYDCLNFNGKLRYKWTVNEEHKGKDFLQIYDKTKSPFKKFLITLLRNQIRNFFQRKKIKFDKEDRTADVTKELPKSESDLKYCDNFCQENPFANAMEKEIILREQLYNISVKLLKDGVIGFVLDGDRMLDRGLLNVWQLLREGYKKNEIGEMLGYSGGRISQLIKQLRTFKEIIDYRQLLCGN